MTDTSQKQIAANRENSKRGGVKTVKGKAITRYNAVKHGLLSQEVLLEDENAAELDTLGKKLRAEMSPTSALELMLVDRITANTWRLRRVMQIEREMMDNKREAAENLGKVMRYDFINYDTYGKLIRYETSIERGIYKALHELQRLQAARNGEKVPLPIALDIDVSGEKSDGFVS